MPDFKSSKPKPVWMKAAQTISDASGFPLSVVSPDAMLGPLGDHIAARAEGPDFIHPRPGTSQADMQLRAYGNVKRHVSGNLPPDSDAIVDLPYSEKKKL